MKQFFALVFLSSIGICFLRAENQPTNKDVDPDACSRIILHGGWKLRTSSGLSDSGEKISSPDYTLNTSWLPAVVPGTVLASYVKAGLHPDPYVGLNNKLFTPTPKIPDASIPGSPFTFAHWYRTTFKVPDSFDGFSFKGRTSSRYQT